MQKNENNKGFTLVELIVVIAIIGVLAAVLVPQYIQYIDKARQAKAVQEASAINDAAQIALTSVVAANGSTGSIVFEAGGKQYGRITNYWLTAAAVNVTDKGAGLAKAFVSSLGFSKNSPLSSVPISSSVHGGDNSSCKGELGEKAKFQVLFSTEYSVVRTEYSRNGYFIKIENGAVTSEKITADKVCFTKTIQKNTTI